MRPQFTRFAGLAATGYPIGTGLSSTQSSRRRPMARRNASQPDYGTCVCHHPTRILTEETAYAICLLPRRATTSTSEWSAGRDPRRLRGLPRALHHPALPAVSSRDAGHSSPAGRRAER